MAVACVLLFVFFPDWFSVFLILLNFFYEVIMSSDSSLISSCEVFMFCVCVCVFFVSFGFGLFFLAWFSEFFL